MTKVNILYIVFLLSVIAMIVSIRKTLKNKDLKGSMKMIFIYLTVFIPFLGLFLTYKVKK